MKRLGASVCLVAIAGMLKVAVAQPVQATIEGRWFGALKNQDGDRHCWLSDRRSNGTYRTDFLTEDAGMFERYVEEGRWAQSAGAFATLVETKNGAPIPPRRFDYAILSLITDRLIYRHIPSGIEFATTRVAADFQLPDRCGIQ